MLAGDVTRVGTTTSNAGTASFAGSINGTGSLTAGGVAPVAAGGIANTKGVTVSASTVSADSIRQAGIVVGLNLAVRVKDPR